MAMTKRKCTNTTSRSGSSVAQNKKSVKMKDENSAKLGGRSSNWQFKYWHHLTTTWAQMPSHLQFNPYIQNGYRKITTWKGCLFSLLFLHNETLNILTHVPVAFFAIKNWAQFWPWESLLGQPYLYGLGISHTIAMVVPWIPSCFYHTFMCHRRGQGVYTALLKFDTLGIWMTEFFGSLTNLAAATWNLPEGVQGVVMGIFNVSSFYGLAKCAQAATPKDRVLCFAPLFTARVLSIFLRLTPWGGGEPAVFLHVILQDLTSIAGGVIGIARVPEKWFQAKFDYFLNSHNIMHLLVILAVWHMNVAANGDARWIIAQITKK